MRFGEPHNCPGCGVYYAPSAEYERERCYQCAGISHGDHVQAISGERQSELGRLVKIRTSASPHTVELGAEGNGRPSTDDLLDALEGLS